MMSKEQRNSGSSLLILIFICITCLPGITQASSELSIQKNGQFMIEGLLPLTDSTGNLLENSVFTAEAMIYAIRKINKENQSHIGYKIIDNKGENLHIIMDQAIRIVSQHRPQSTCRADDHTCTTDGQNGTYQRISALIGPMNSAPTVPVASLLGLYSIPVVAYSASSTQLSNTDKFRSFLRTIPSDKYQAEALAAFVHHFQWNYVFFIGNDDEYGREGLAAFKSAIRGRKICTADEINIAFERNDVAEQIKRTVDKMSLLKDRVQVVVLFMFAEQAAQVMLESERRQIRNITWVFSDAVRSNILKYIPRKELLHGAFAVDFVSKEISGFREFIENVTVKSANDNPWLTRLLEEQLQCSTTPKADGKRHCHDNETLPLTPGSLSNHWSSIVNMINCVNVISHGLHSLINCVNGSGLLEDGACPNKTFPVQGKDLLLYMQNTVFRGAMGDMVGIDKDGELTTKEYFIRNYVYNKANETLLFRKIATWSSTMPSLINFTAHYVWKGVVRPYATCSAACIPGQMQVGQSDCCWACHPCPKGAISNTTSATYCTQCPPDHYANLERTQCLKVVIDYIEARDPFSVVVLVICLLGLLFLLLISVRFYQVRTSPLIQDSDRILLTVFILSTILAFIFPMFQVTLYRSNGVCRFLSALLLYTLLLVSVSLLAKTQTCSNHIKMLITLVTSSKAVERCSNLILIMAAIIFQLVLFGIWYLTGPPSVHTMVETRALHLRDCNSQWPAARFIAYAFPLVLLFLATVFAFKERNNKFNHSEAKYVSFCTISMCILLIAFFPTYRFVKGITTSVVIATTSIVGAFAVIGCILLPKAYILILHPERNVAGQPRSSEPTISSAHTAGSHPASGGSSGHNYHGNGKTPRLPNDRELTSSSSSHRPGNEKNTLSTEPC